MLAQFAPKVAEPDRHCHSCIANEKFSLLRLPPNSPQKVMSKTIPQVMHC